MANLTYGVIRGERDFNAYCLRRWKEKARFVESFAHNITGVHIERIYAKSPTDDGYKEYFIMTMESSRETEWNDTGDIRRKVHEDIRNGRIALLKV